MVVRSSANFQALNKRLLISNDTYIRTTMEHHKESSRKLWSICAEKGDIYLGKYEVSLGISERLTTRRLILVMLTSGSLPLRPVDVLIMIA